MQSQFGTTRAFLIPLSVMLLVVMVIMSMGMTIPVAASTPSYSAFPTPVPLYLPANVRASCMLPNIKVTWTDTNIYETGYYIEKYLNDELTATIQLGVNSTQWLDSGVGNGRYRYKVCTNGNLLPVGGLCSWTKLVRVPIDCPVLVQPVD